MAILSLTSIHLFLTYVNSVISTLNKCHILVCALKGKIIIPLHRKTTLLQNVQSNFFRKVNNLLWCKIVLKLYEYFVSLSYITRLHFLMCS